VTDYVAWLPFILLLTLVASYMIGSIPFAYIIVRRVTGQDVSERGSGNVGAMNVRRSTGSWGWFSAAMISDALKGFAPVALAKLVAISLAGSTGSFFAPWTQHMEAINPGVSEGVVWALIGLVALPMLAVAGSVLGHNYSLWFALIKRRFGRTGKGLATGGGALLAYDWRYFALVLVVGLLTIAVTRYMMAGQVAAAVTLPASALLLGSADWVFAASMGAVVYAAHHRRFIGLLSGNEPRLYVNDDSGPRG